MTASSLAQGSLMQPDLPEWSFDKLTGFSPDAVIVLDAETRILYLNPVAEALFGYSLAEALGRTLDIFLPEAFISTHRHYVASIQSEAGLACRMGTNRNVYGKHRDGHFIPLDISLAYRRWKGQPLTVCIPRDISEQFNYQHFLNESEQRYRSMIDLQNTLVVRVDREGRFVFANQAYCQMFGKQLDELLGCSFTPLVHPDDLAATLEAMQGLEAPPYRITVEQRAMTVKGWRWIAWEDSVIRDPDRNLYEIQGVGADITERKQVEEMALAQRDLAIILAQKSTLAEALPLCLDLAMQVSEMDVGGIYLVAPQKGGLILWTHKGLSAAFTAQVEHYEVESDRYEMVLRGDPVYAHYATTSLCKRQVHLDEGLKSFAVIPLKSKGKVIACINVASRTLDEMPDFRRKALENIAIHIGNVIARFKVQEELLESQNELQSMFDSLQDYVFVLDEQGEIIQVNQKVVASLGYEHHELTGKSVLAVHPPDQHALAVQIVQEMLAGVLDTCPLDLLKKDGSRISVETKVARGRWGSRDVLIGVSRDIAERKAADEARIRQTKLLEYRNQFEEILTSMSTRFINLPPSEIGQEIDHVLKKIGEFEQVDRSYVFLIDRRAAEMSNLHEWCAPGVQPQIEQSQHLPIRQFPRLMKKLDDLEEIHVPAISQLPPQARNEREIFKARSIQSLLVVPLVANNAMIGLLGFDSVSRQRYWSQDSILLIKMVGDILSNALMRRQMEIELRQSETHNRALLSAVPDMIFRLRRDGVFLDFKADASRLLVLPPERIIGASIGVVLPGPLTQKALACIENTLQTHEIQTMEYTLDIGDSAFVFEARFKDSGPNEVTAIVRDVSERARLEQMKSDFINRATHELRTPIATMLLMVSLIDSAATVNEYREYWEVLKNELNRERMLVEDLLSAGRLESDRAHLHFRSLNMVELARRAVGDVEIPAREKGLSLDFKTLLEPGSSSVLVRADESAMLQVFANLLMNAIKFTPPGGGIQVSLQRRDRGLEINVADTGMGIPGEDLPLLFTRFFRATNAIADEIPGTGIGLFIVRSVLEKHGGSIKVHSKLGKGTQFDLWLPTID